MHILEKPFDGVMVLEPLVYHDGRGFFLENFQKQKYRDLGINEEFVQDNHSRSVKGVLRGMHFTKLKPQAQILTVMHGHIFDVVVDIRVGSATYGQWFGIELHDRGPRQIYMSHGFAHGFCTLSDTADLNYKCSEYYDASDNFGIRWDDQDIGIKWPVSDPIISERDRNHPLLSDS